MWCYAFGGFGNFGMGMFRGFGFGSILWIALAVAWIVLAVKMFSKTRREKNNGKNDLQP